MQHAFDTAIELESLDAGRFVGATSPSYANMVGPFGGVTSAVLLNAALQHPEVLGGPISLTVNFASPLVDGTFEIVANPVRTNRSTQHWILQLTQSGVVAATATAVFALRRETWSASEAVMPSDLPSVLDLARSPIVGRPPWVHRYDMRFASGEMHFDGQEQPNSYSQLWVRDEPPRPLDFASLAAICDCFFPRIFVRRRVLAPIGTVSLTTFFHADAAMLAGQGDRHVFGCARASNYRNGYYDQSAEVWSDDGQLLASTHQIVYFRD